MYGISVIKSRRSLTTKIVKSSFNCMVDGWHSCPERWNEVCAIFFDLKKAFNTVPHHPLLDKLTPLNINPSVLQWLESYLIHQFQFVFFGGESQVSCRGQSLGLFCSCSVLIGLWRWSQAIVFCLFMLMTIKILWDYRVQWLCKGVGKHQSCACVVPWMVHGI